MAEKLAVALLLATPGTTWGGMEKHTADLAYGLSCRGHTVQVFAHPDYQNRFPKPILFHPVPVEQGRNNPYLIWRLRQLLKQNRPDICHAQGNKAATLLHRANLLLPNPWRPLTIGTVHNSKSSVQVFAHLDGAIAVSRSVLQTLDHPQGRFIHNGVASPAATTPESPRFAIPAQRPLLIAMGRLEPTKQFDRLIEAWSRSEQPGVLTILGEGSERKKLQTLIDSLGLSDTVILPGMETDVLPWLQAATACVISSAREGFPYVMIEALMAGCPVLSTPVSDASDFLPETCLARSDTIHDLTNLLNTNLSASQSLREIQGPSFDKARTDLTLDAMVDQTMKYYRSLLASPSQASPTKRS